MKKKLIALLLCLMLVASVAIPGTLAVGLDTAESTSEMSVAASAETASVFFGQEYANTVSVPVDGKIVLSVGCTADILGAQWQIYAPAAGVWANIYGETGTTCAVSYAMVRNMLDGEGLAKVRCLVSVADGSVVTQTVSVGVDESAAPVSGGEEASEAPVILSDAVVTANITDAPAPFSLDTAAVPAAFSLDADEPADDTDVAPAADDPVLINYNIVINYIFGDGSFATDSWTATVSKGSAIKATVISPEILGYTPDRAQVELDIESVESDQIINVTYSPALVDYTVVHYQQNVDNDEYTVADTVHGQMLTGTSVSFESNKELIKNYEGFYALPFETVNIAADGSTVIEIKYDRNYYLMNFNLDGGYGVEPIYARYGTPISISEPTKAGYIFTGWEPAVPSSVPVNGGTYNAQWTAGKTGFTVVFWYENADNDNYSFVDSVSISDAIPGSTVSSEAYKDQSFAGRDNDHFTYNSDKTETVTVAGDGSTVLNVYYSRNKYTITFPNVVLTCTKTEHTHSDECCKYGGTSFTHWWHSDSCCKDNLTVHTHGNTCYTQNYAITAKFDSDISYVWETDPIKSLLDAGYVFKSSVTDKYYSFLEKMPGQDITMTKTEWSGNTYTWYYYLEVPAGMSAPDGSTTRTDGGKTYYLYHTTSVKGSNISLTYDEDYFPITGYTQRDDEVPGFNDRTAYLYYTRNQYDLKFMNYGTEVSDKGGSYYYQQDISDTNFTPDYPDTLEKGAYVFEGWYDNPFFNETGKFEFSGATMPAGPMILYAHWVPVTHKVNVYLDDTVQDQLGDTQVVTHGSKAVAPQLPADHKYKEYNFVAWFYKDENGVEHAFDFENMPVNRDMDLYAKWSSDKLVPYFIYYKLEDGTEIADYTSGSALAGNTKTFDALGGDELYEAYREGYFPVTKSHSLTMDISGGNEYTFIYTAKDAVPYTVKYLEVGTGNVLHEEKHVDDNRKAVVTENFVKIKGYLPDAYQKRLVVSAEDGAVNEIIFYYTKDDTHAYYQATHYIQNLDGTDYLVYSQKETVGVIGRDYSEDAISIPGFAFNAEKSTVSGTLTEDGLELKLYYDRIAYPYQIRYLEQGTNNVLHTPTDGTEKYGRTVQADALDIAGYDLISDTPQLITIKIEDPDDTAAHNVAIFYYKEKEVTINYQVVGPNGCGTVSPTSETLKVLSGDAQGSTATAKENFRFVGWFKDAGCTQAVDASWVDGSGKLTPQKNNRGLFEAATYYAKFTRKTASLTITKSGANANANDSFIFDVVGNEGSRFTVSVGGNGSVTIAGLPVGETFTVTERNDWSWRYSADSPSVTIQAEGSSVTVTNTVNKSYLLDGSDYKQNNAVLYNKGTAGN